MSTPPDSSSDPSFLNPIEYERFVSLSGQVSFRALLAAVPDALVIVNTAGEIVLINALAERLFGYSRLELAGHSIETLLPERLRNQHITHRLAYLANPQTRPMGTHLELSCLRRDGSEFPVEIGLSPLQTEFGLVILSVIRDISERKLAELTLRRSEELYRVLLQNLPQVAILLFDHNLRYLLVEGAALAQHGYVKEKILGRTIHEVLAPALSEQLEPYYQAALIGESPTLELERGSHIYFIRLGPVRDETGQVWAGLAVAEEITERKRAETSLRKSEERYALAARGANDGLWDWDLPGDHIYLSPRWKAMLGYAEHELSDDLNEWFNRVHPEDLEALQLALWSHIHQETTHFEHEYRLLHRTGAYRWMLCRGLAVQDKRGQPYRMVGSQTDITRRKAVEAQLLHDAFHDALTGLPNRALFMDHLARSIGHVQRRVNYHFAVLFIDLDHFKLINDSLSHTLGDTLLMTIAHRLKKCVRPGDTVARLGGDEFVILLDDLPDPAEARLLAERLQQQIAVPVRLAGQQIVMSASVGLVLSQNNPTSQPSDQPADLLRDADIAMYQAKAGGRARVEEFNPAMRAKAVSRLELEAQLRQALERQEFRVYCQPVIALPDRQIVGIEALLRWQHPDRGLIYPVEFISALEETGLIVPVGEWMLEVVCTQVQQWRQAGYSTLRGAVNLSVRQLQDSSLPQQIERILSRTGLSPEGLELEITESVAMQSVEASLAMLSHLQMLGLRLAIDDFGVGYSSLSRLQRLPVSILKIDRSFVSDIGSHAASEAITRAIIAMAHHLDLRVIAEGVEMEQQLSILQAQQCDEVQGYLFSPPVPPDLLTSMLERQHAPTKLEGAGIG